MDRVLKSICNFVGEPDVPVTKRKYLVARVPEPFPVSYEVGAAAVAYIPTCRPGPFLIVLCGVYLYNISQL